METQQAYSPDLLEEPTFLVEAHDQTSNLGGDLVRSGRDFDGKLDPDNRSQPAVQPRSILAHVPELDGLRGLLALWVMLSHICCWCGWMTWNPPRRLQGVWTEVMFAKGAVETFMILSGFVISFLLARQRTTYARFMLGRFFRIYPTYAFCLILGLISIPVTPRVLEMLPWGSTSYFRPFVLLSEQDHRNFWPHLLAHLTLLHGMVPKTIMDGSADAILATAWSISLEWQYYLVAPLLARYLRNSTFLVGLGIIGWLGLHYSWLWETPQLAFFLSQLPFFLIGIGSFHLYALLSSSPGGIASNLSPVAAILAVASLLFFRSIALAIWSITFGSILGGDQGAYSWFLRQIRLILVHPLCSWLGKISYSLYLVHLPLIICLMYNLTRAFPTISRASASAAMFVGGVPLIVLAACLIQRFIEAPTMAIGKRT